MSQWVDYRALKQSVGIAQVLSSYHVQLKPVGPDQLRGRCPLPTHGSERSRESFSVHTAKNVWACHSASCREARQGGVGGNVLDLVALLQRCSIREAALQLQGGWPTENRPWVQLASKGSSSSPTPIRPLPFSLRLSWHPYLDYRGVHPAAAARFGVGYYAGPGFLRGRVAFPIHDSEGRLVAYAGRSIDGSEPRYLFPPGFRKSQVVFNLHHAGAEAGRPTGCVIVEGFFDCLRLHQAGYRKVIALMGANLSEMQETLLLASFREVVLMLDGDEAGRWATRRVAARLRGRISLHIAEVPSGRQPDQLSSEEIEQILSGASGDSRNMRGT
jgi:DNA primase